MDATDPVIDTNINGTPGKNGWYISTASVSGSAVDATSGLNTLESNLDSAGWTAYGSPISVADGSHSVSFYAEDVAGQSAQTDLTVNVDTHAPQIGGSIGAGTAGQNGWYTSPVTLNVTASDPTPGSGVASFTASVDGGAPADGSLAINLTDGQHMVVFDAEDTAGLPASLTRSVNVDSVPPTLSVDASLPLWNRGSVSFAGSAADALSGLARVEISTDNGLTWRSTSGTATWTFDWDTTTADDGDRVVRIRSVDTAGLTTESAFYVGVDNHGPQISAPANWSVDDTVTLAVTDAGSGVDEVVVKILDPLNRYPTRVLQYEGGVFPLAFTWDRHFEDGTLAPHGEYTVLITAADNFGNESVVNAKVGVPLIGHIFGGYNTATPMPTLLPTLTPTPRGLAPTLAPTSTLAATELAFGVPVTGAGGTSPGAPASPAPHSSPPSLGFTSFVQDVFFPASGSTLVETSTTSPAAQPLSAASAGVLFGSAATAATTGLAAYYLQKKKEEEEARREAILAKIEAEQKAAEKQREAIFERNAQVAAGNLKLAIEVMRNLGVDQKTIDLVRNRYTEIGVDSAISLANAAIKVEKTIIPYTREKFDLISEHNVVKGYSWNPEDGVVSLFASEGGRQDTSTQPIINNELVAEDSLSKSNQYISSNSFIKGGEIQTGITIIDPDDIKSAGKIAEEGYDTEDGKYVDPIYLPSNIKAYNGFTVLVDLLALYSPSGKVDANVIGVLTWSKNESGEYKIDNILVQNLSTFSVAITDISLKTKGEIIGNPNVCTKEILYKIADPTEYMGPNHGNPETIKVEVNQRLPDNSKTSISIQVESIGGIEIKPLRFVIDSNLLQ